MEKLKHVYGHLKKATITIIPGLIFWNCMHKEN